MADRRTHLRPVIDPARYGISFSLKQCRSFGVDQTKALKWLLGQGWRRFRLMSYWDEHEKQPGVYDFAALDKQIELVAKAGGVISLCLGARQPRWPENHWPEWAWKTSKAERTEALLHYIAAVVTRYKHEPAVTTYQLENEALLRSFGRRAEVDRGRLRDEFTLIKLLDPHRPIIMSTSTSWGVPVRRPLPDVVGFSYYHVYWDGKEKRYKKASGHYAWLHKFRAGIIRVFFGRPSFIHELQCEPWAPKGIWEVSSGEQAKSMGPEQIRQSFARAHQTGLHPVDIWGAEWWYWRHQQGDDTIWQAVKSSFR